MLLRVPGPWAIPAVSLITAYVLRALTAPASAHAALRSAAGGGGSGGGFSALTSYLDKIATYLVPVGGALAVVGLIYGGSLLMTGSPYAGRTLAYVVIGVVIVLASKGIAA